MSVITSQAKFIMKKLAFMLFVACGDSKDLRIDSHSANQKCYFLLQSRFYFVNLAQDSRESMNL